MLALAFQARNLRNDGPKLYVDWKTAEKRKNGFALSHVFWLVTNGTQQHLCLGQSAAYCRLNEVDKTITGIFVFTQTTRE